MVRVIGYARLSRASESSTSIARQREIIAQTADARGWSLVETVVDNDVSASRLRLNRPGIKRVRAAVAAGEADAVIVWRLDRLARSVVDFGTLIDEGVSIVSATESFDTTTAQGRAMASLLQVFAELESATTRLRVTDSRRHLATTGRWPGGQPPYGYVSVPLVGGGRTLAVNDAEAATLRRMVDAVLGGASLYATLRDLNAEGSRTRRGTAWTLTSTQRLLTSPTLLGRATYKGKVVRDDGGLPVTPFPALVSPEEHTALVGLFAPDPDRAEATRAGRRKATRLLSGLVYCAGCNSRLVVRQNQHSSRPATYSCPSRQRGVECDLRVSARADALEAAVTDDFLAVHGRGKVVALVRHEADSGELVAILEAIRDTTDEMRDPGADVAGLVDRLTMLQTRRVSLEAAPVATWIERVPTGQTYAEAWHAADVHGKRRMLESAGLEAVLHPADGPRGMWHPDRVAVQYLDVPDAWADVDPDER